MYFLALKKKIQYRSYTLLCFDLAIHYLQTLLRYNNGFPYAIAYVNKSFPLQVEFITFSSELQNAPEICLGYRKHHYITIISQAFLFSWGPWPSQKAENTCASVLLKHVTDSTDKHFRAKQSKLLWIPLPPHI